MTTCHLQASGTIEQFFYGELDANGRASVQEHLPTCAQCRQALDDMRTIRIALSTRPDVSSPPGGDWTGFMARLDDAVRPPAVGGAEVRGTGGRLPFGIKIAASIAASLALVTATVGYLTRSAPSEPPATVVRDEKPTSLTPGSVADGAVEVAGDSVDRAFASLSEQHFERSKLVVFGLANRDVREMSADDWQYERQLASVLLDDTRLYRLTAEDRGLKSLAGVMGDLELVLLQTALSSDAEPATLQRIQRLIQKRDLVTRMEVVAAGL